MLKRLWWVLSVLWCAAWLYNGSTKVDGIQSVDVWFGFFPLLMGPVLGRLATWILYGR